MSKSTASSKKVQKSRQLSQASRLQKPKPAPKRGSKPRTRSAAHPSRESGVKTGLSPVAPIPANQTPPQKYLDTFDFAPIGYFALDSSGRIADVNFNASSLLNVNQQDLLGRRFADFVAPDFARIFADHLERALSTDSRQTCELLLLKKSGESFHAQLESISVPDASGSSRHIRTSILDLRKIEEHLRQGERRYHHFWEMMSDFLFQVSVRPEGQTVEWITEKFTEISGYSIEEMKSAEQGLLTMSHPDDLERMKEFNQQLLAGYPGEIEARIITKAGKTVWLKYIERPIFDDQGSRVVGYIGAASDISHQKELEEERESQRKLLEQIMDRAGSLLIVMDREGRVVRFNKSCERITGYKAEELLGKPFWDYLVLNQEIAGVKNEFKNILRGKPSREYENYWKTNDGGKRLIEWRNGYVRDRNGTVQYVIGTGIDITEQRKAEDELKRHRENLEGLVSARTSEISRINTELEMEVAQRRLAESELVYSNNLLESFFSTTYLKIAYLDASFNFIRVNRAYAEAESEPEGFFIGKNYFELYPDRARRKIFRRVLETGKPHTAYGQAFERKDHPERGPSYLDWTLYPLSNAQGKVEALLLNALDVTERIKAEQAVRAEQDRLFAVLDMLPASIHLRAEDCSIPFANQRFRENFGDPAGKPCFEILGHRDQPCENCHAAMVMETRQVRVEEKTRFNGRIYEAYEMPLYDKDGAPLLLEMDLDITDQKKAQEAQQTAEQELEKHQVAAIHADRLRSLGEMAASIAHELNQPLLGMRGLAEHIAIALERGWSLPKQDILEKVNLIIKQADRMSHVVEHTRMFGRQADRADLLPIDVNDVINSSLPIISPLLRSEGLALKTEFADWLPLVLVNPFSLEEAILNLISNARDATIEQRRKEPAAREIQLRTSLDNGQGKKMVRIEVGDEGPGIPDEIREKLFTPFFSTKSAEKGTGLGLAITKSLIESFGGTVELSAAPHKGTVASILIPSAEKDGGKK